MSRSRKEGPLHLDESHIIFCEGLSVRYLKIARKESVCGGGRTGAAAEDWDIAGIAA